MEIVPKGKFNIVKGIGLMIISHTIHTRVRKDARARAKYVHKIRNCKVEFTKLRNFAFYY